jgi:protease YdgD
VIGRATIALALCLLGAPLAAQDALRPLALRQDLLGWEGVGRLDLDGGYCTAVLVSADTVLTAAHCLFRGSEPRDRASLRFRAGDTRGDAIAERGILQGAVPPDYRPDHPDPARRIASDVALLRLDAPIPAATARPFRIDPVGEGNTVSLVSYGEGRDAVLSRQMQCRVLARQDDVLAFDCEATFGSSGAPVFRIDGSRIRIVSVVVGGSDAREGRRLTFGPALHDAFGALSAELRSGRGLWPEARPGPRRVMTDGDRSAGGARFLRP